MVTTSRSSTPTKGEPRGVYCFIDHSFQTVRPVHVVGVEDRDVVTIAPLYSRIDCTVGAQILCVFQKMGPSRKSLPPRLRVENFANKRARYVMGRIVDNHDFDFRKCLIIDGLERVRYERRMVVTWNNH